MINTSTFKRLAVSTATAAAFLLIGGTLNEASAQQRDPFKKAGWATPKKQSTGTPSGAVKAKATTATTPVNYAPPAIESRIEYFKRLRDAAAQSGQPLPKVTSVLTLSEMAVTGIFKTPRGWAAMVEATPIKLSYTVFPGEKFFDGQLVAVEENRLVFRKVTKVGEGKFVSSVENKPLRVYSAKANAEGTAPVQSAEVKTPEQTTQPAQTASATQPAAEPVKTTPKPASNPFLSPLDEMERQPAEPAKDKEAPKKSPKKTTKVAKKTSGN